MERQVYIHYGHNRFDPNKFEPIKNERLWVKPKGGLWASKIDASFGWKEWCEAEIFRDCNINNAFKFTLSDYASIAILSTISDIRRLPMVDTSPDPTGSMLGFLEQAYIDFEKCLANGIDAIELCWYGDEYSSQARDNLHFTLYGWDCDSIIILNPDIVQPI